MSPIQQIGQLLLYREWLSARLHKTFSYLRGSLAVRRQPPNAEQAERPAELLVLAVGVPLCELAVGVPLRELPAGLELRPDFQGQHGPPPG